MPADVRERYEKLRESDLRTVAPRAEDKEDDVDTDDADDDGDDAEEISDSSSQQVSFQSSPCEVLPNTISF
jgi:hypothetical protein